MVPLIVIIIISYYDDVQIKPTTTQFRKSRVDWLNYQAETFIRLQKQH